MPKRPEHPDETRIRLAETLPPLRSAVTTPEPVPDEDDDLPDTYAHARYEVDCPSCGDPFDVDHDPAGEVLTCPVCDERCRVIETH